MPLSQSYLAYLATKKSLENLTGETIASTYIAHTVGLISGILTLDPVGIGKMYFDVTKTFVKDEQENPQNYDSRTNAKFEKWW